MGSDEHFDAAVKIAQTRVGTVLRGKYRLDRLLGVGGMAAVYEATHRNGSRAAIKMLHPVLSVHSDVRTRFLREGYVANAVGHVGAVRVADDDTADDGSAFLVMELLEGDTVDSLWDRAGRKLPCEYVLAVADQLLEVLTAAHANGIVHRDVKPENLFLTREGVVKLLDFGIARMRDLASASTATRTGATLGTPPFMSPEQALGRSKQIDASSDVYAVGAVMFTLISGEYVHEGESVNEQLVRAATEKARPLRSVAPDVPEAVAKLVDRAVQFEKADRWGSAVEMREALGVAQLEVYGHAVLGRPALGRLLGRVERARVESPPQDRRPEAQEPVAAPAPGALDRPSAGEKVDPVVEARTARPETLSKTTPGPLVVAESAGAAAGRADAGERARRRRVVAVAAAVTGAACVFAVAAGVALRGNGKASVVPAEASGETNGSAVAAALSVPPARSEAGAVAAASSSAPPAVEASALPVAIGAAAVAPPGRDQPGKRAATPAKSAEAGATPSKGKPPPSDDPFGRQ
jgi:serine/threonine-protein kinase